ncbi:MAG: ABC transporter ATP-binding protein [Dehalococcoidia bacterium]|nr:ABC transporter ATP-binding protein [Dehalococcoidia bacterium]
MSKGFRERSGWVEALREVSIAAAGGEFVTIIGPSGCGKSTLFNIISGVIAPDEGEVLIQGQDARGRVGLAGYMPQKDLLLPWRTVLDNVVLGMEVSGMKAAAAREQARPMLGEFGLAGFEGAYPAALSGGMRQRAALLRTVLFHRDILLLDEPFGALDALTRRAMHEWLLGLWGRLGKTILFVTHDVEEAVLLSDRVYVMSARPGRIIGELAIPLPRPRHAEIALGGEFVELKRLLLGMLRGEAAA